MTEAFKVPYPSKDAVQSALESFGKDPSCGVPPSIFIADAVYHANKVDVPGIVRQEVAKALLWRSQQEHGVEPACLGPEDYAYLARFGCPHNEILMCAGGPCKQCGFLTSPETATDSQLSRFPEAAPEEGPCMFNACPHPEECDTKCRQQNPLRHKDGSLREEYKGTVLDSTPRGAPEPGQKREGHFAGCCIDTDHKGPCLRRCEETEPTPSARVESERETVLRRMGHDHPVLHSAKLCDCERLVDSLRPSQGQVTGSVPEEPKHTHTYIGQRGCPGCDAIRTSPLPKPCTACACPRCQAKDEFVRELAAHYASKTPPAGTQFNEPFRSAGGADRKLLEVR